MDFGKVLSRAWEITWRWKVLWILGFLASLGSGGGGGGGGSSYSGDSQDWSGWQMQGPGEEMLPAVIALIVAVACVAILIGIALWVVSIMARGGLIAGVQQVEDEGSTGFLQAWRMGRKRFWTLFGISVLAGLPLLILVVLLIVLFIAGLAGADITADSQGSGAVWAVLAPTLLCGGAFCCGTILVAIVLGQIKVYADRAAILEGLGWIDAFKRGWEVLKANIGPTLVFWLIFLAIGVVIAILIFGALAAVGLPLIAIFTSIDIEPGPWVLVPICCGGLLFVIVAALISSIVTTFTSATWTLAYREMTGLAAQPAVIVEE